MNTSIGKRGYTIQKDELTSSQIYEIRQELTVKPFMSGDYGAAPTPFPVYCESTRKLYLPRYFGLKKYGKPTSNKIEEGEKVTMEFPLSLKPKQIPIVEAYMKAAEEVGGGIISVPCGYGKTVIGLYLASKLGVSERIISVSIIAFGTSIPELSTSIIAIINKEEKISIGNLIGSNIFDMLGVIGITAILSPIYIMDEKLITSDLIWMLAIAILLLPLVFFPNKMKFGRQEGIILILFYIFYIARLF